MKIKLEYNYPEIKISYEDIDDYTHLRGGGDIFRCYETGYVFSSSVHPQVAKSKIFIFGTSDVMSYKVNTIMHREFGCRSKRDADLFYKRLHKAFKNFTNYLKDEG